MYISLTNTIGALRKRDSGPIPDRAPRALNVAFTGTLKEGNVLTGAYTYYDANGDAEGATSFKWYRADNSGDVGIAISGATSETYTSTASDLGKYISFEVTPRALTGTILVGTPTFSPYQQVESTPVASDVAYTGTLTDEQVQTGTFTYSGSKPQGTSTFRWLRATDDAGTSATAIGGATSETYTLQTADAGNFVAFEVTPISDTGLVGAVVVSSYRTEVQDIAPIASAVSYTGTLESTEVQSGVYTYSGNTEGTSTFVWYRADDISGTNQTVIAGATSQTYTLQSADVDKHVAFDVTPVTVNGKSGSSVRSNYRAVIASGGDVTSFITTWRTTTASETITIPTIGSGYNYAISTSDGQTFSGVTGNQAITFASAGDYDISISGDFPSIYFNGNSDAPKIIDVKQWGNITWGFLNNSFRGCVNLTGSVTDSPDLSNVTTMSFSFYLDALFNADISSWNVSNVTDMSGAFRSCTTFNSNISAWDVSNVTNMNSMFFGASSFTDNLSNWDISNVTDMTNFGKNVTFSTADYNATLIGWEATLQAAFPNGTGYTPTININFGNSEYSGSGAAATARASLISNFGWTITDGGIATEYLLKSDSGFLLQEDGSKITL